MLVFYVTCKKTEKKKKRCSVSCATEVLTMEDQRINTSPHFFLIFFVNTSFPHLSSKAREPLPACYILMLCSQSKLTPCISVTHSHCPQSIVTEPRTLGLNDPFSMIKEDILPLRCCDFFFFGQYGNGMAWNFYIFCFHQWFTIYPCSKRLKTQAE